MSDDVWLLRRDPRVGPVHKAIVAPQVPVVIEVPLVRLDPKVSLADP